MEGLFQLLIIVFFIVAAIFDATKRNRERQRRQEQMEAEELEAEGGMEDRSTAEARERRRRRKAPMGREEGASSGGRDEPATVARSGGQKRETADELVPEDLWAILTGQPRTQESEPEAPTEHMPEPAESRTHPPGRPPSREREGRGRVGEGRFDPLPERPHIPEPTPSDRLSEIRKETDDRETVRPTRRSARWIEGVETERDRVAAEEAAAFGSMADEEPWNRFEDISAGEILDGEGRVQAAADPGGAKRRRRGAGRGQYTRLLETGRLEDLRKAVVLREVLGPPVGFREPGEGN